MVAMQPSDTSLGVDTTWEAWLDRLRIGVIAPSADDGPLYPYVIADSRANPNLDKLLDQVPGLEWTSLWQDSALETYTDIAPYLIAIDQRSLGEERSLHYRLAKRLWMEGIGQYMLTWLWSPYPVEALADHFRSFCMYTLPDRRTFYLHFYDNRILSHLRRVWSDDEQQAFISPCVELWYSDRLHGDVVWRNDAIVMPEPRHDPQPLAFGQHQALLSLAYPDKLALHLRTACGSILDHLTPLDLHRLVSGQIERAARYRIHEESDLRTYATYGVLVGPAFDEHPPVRDRLLAAKRQETTLSDALGGISQEVWDAIRKGREHA